MSLALVIHSSNEEPQAKKLKVVLEDILIPSPTPLNSFRPTIIDNIPYEQFIANLFNSGSFEFSPAPPRMYDKEIKRLVDLKAMKEKFEKKLKRVLTPQEVKAQEEELAAYEAKQAKMMEEYNHCITFRDYPLPITKFSYRVNNSIKEATMRITRNNQPLNLKIYDKFVLMKLGFTEWLDLHALLSRVQTKSNDQLLKTPKAKF
ncbi:hypothetical protein Tco_0204693 [Tanacetum coccineum]